MGRGSKSPQRMKSKLVLTMAVAVLAANLASISSAWAQGPQAPAPDLAALHIKTTFIKLGNGVPGVLYEPTTPGPKSEIGVFVMHASGDYTEFSACSELSRRGYRVLCANNSTSKSGAFDDGIIDQVLLEAKHGVSYLKAYPGVRKVVLFGHSGGATIMTAYQAIAENGVKVCQGVEKIHKCPDSLAGLPAADGVVMADANWGQAEMTLFSIDPAVTRTDSGMSLDPALDMFNPANGFKPSGSTYSQAFIAKFQKAEGRRGAAVVKLAQDRLAAIEAGRGLYADDEPFTVPGASFMGGNNKLYSQDIRLLSHSRRPWTLVHADGSTMTQIIRSVRVPQNTRNLSAYMMLGALKTTVRNYLSSYAIRVTDDFGYDEDAISGVDWTSTYASPPGNVESVAAPLLTLGMTGNWEGLAAETIHDHAKSADKSIAFIEGANHIYLPCTKCEKTPGQFGDTVKTTYDYIDGWLSKPGRFLVTGN